MPTFRHLESHLRGHSLLAEFDHSAQTKLMQTRDVGMDMPFDIRGVLGFARTVLLFGLVGGRAVGGLVFPPRVRRGENRPVQDHHSCMGELCPKIEN